MPIAQDGTILVTGGAGYIGSHAVLALLDGGYRVAVIDDLSTGMRWAVPSDAAFYEGDVGDSALLDRVMTGEDVVAVMHFAGSIIVPESVSKPLKYYQNNTANSRTLIEAAVRNGVRHFIFSSTAATYGEPAQIPITENTPTLPINPYGMSKLMTEHMLRDTAFAHDINYCALRYFNVAGADPEGRSGQSTPGATHLIKVAAEAVAGKRDGVAVFGVDYDTPDGTGVRDYIHVSDLAAAHVLALEYLGANPDASLVMNCGYGHGFSVLEVLDAAEKVTGRPIHRRIEPRRAGDPPRLIAANDAIRQTLGWTPRYDDLPTIIAHAMAWEDRLKERRGS